MELVNQTSLLVDRAAYLDRRGAEIFVFAAKATFALKNGVLVPADEAAPIAPIDTFYGAPGASSLRDEAELGPAKPGTDCVLVGHAYPLASGDATGFVRFSIGATSRAARVFGPRMWSNGEPTAPARFDRVALRWENAFGGADDTPEEPSARAYELENPIGRGFVAPGSTKDLEGEALPQIEDPDHLLVSPTPHPDPAHRVRPVGFGFVCRHWHPRAAHAGTYDAAWIKERMPLPPDDLDPRFHHAAPRGLAGRRLLGGEAIRVEGATRSAPIQAKLPRPDVRVGVAIRDHEIRVPLLLDTVRVDADAGLVTLLLKGELDVHGKVDRISATTFEGEVLA